MELLKLSNPAVDSDLLCEILSWNKEGISVDDVIERLRVQIVPSGYTPHTWTIDNIKLTPTRECYVVNH